MKNHDQSTIAKHQSTIAKRFLDLERKESSMPAVMTLEETWSRGDLVELSGSILAELKQEGLAPGDVITIRMRNSAELIATILAILRGGMILLPVDRDARSTEVEKIATTFGARALIREGSPIAIRAVNREPIRTADARLPEKTRLVKLTSGSTGEPRGVATSEANLIADVESICSTMEITPEDVNFGAIPLSHSYGFSNLVMPLLVQGTPVVVSNDYLPLSILELANSRRCTVLPGVPMMFEHLASMPLENGMFETVRTCISAGASLRESTAEKFRQRFDLDIHTFYGCSECGGISYDSRGGAAMRGTVGKTMSGVDAEPASTGTLTVRSDAVALGYVNAGREERGRLGNGVFSTEDIVEITSDEELRIVGRISDLINVAGRKVNPREIENVILTMPGVRDVRVTGVEGGARGQVVAAVVEASGIDSAAVRSFCAKRLAAHKLPRKVRIVERLPRNERGKVRREALTIAE